MNNPKGTKTVTVNGEDYRLFLGLSNIADLQEKHGDDFLHSLEVMANADQENMPGIRMVHDVFLSALQRYHEDVADRWLVDDIIAANPAAMVDLLSAAFPDPSGEGAEGNVPTPPKAVAST